MIEQNEKAPHARLIPSTPVLGSNFAIAISTIPLGLFVVSLLGRHILFSELVGNFRFQILLALLPFLILALAIRCWWLVGTLVVAIGWSSIGTVSVFLPFDQPPSGNQNLKIMSFNVLGTNNQYAQILDEIDRHDPDVLVIVEYTFHLQTALECLDEKYPHQILEPRWHGFGLAVYSKYPFSNTNVIQLTPNVSSNTFAMTDVTFGDQTIRLAALHVISPLQQYRMDLRNRQFSEAADYLSKDQIPTVVVGDFNCVPWSTFLREFLRKTDYRDSRQGFGYQGTWHASAWPPFRIPIDHAFVSNDIHVHDRRTGNPSGSDHHPIIFEISLAR